jgi:hypothetical protein
MNKVEEIFKAWNIAFNPDNEQSELASKRIEICNSCEFKVTNLGINRCSVCGCALKGKVFSPIKGSCPKGKWDKIDGKNNMLNKDNTFISINENWLDDEDFKKYLELAKSKNNNWGERNNTNIWAGRVIYNHQFGLNELNTKFLEKIRNKIKSDFKLTNEIWPDYLGLVKWEEGDMQHPHADAEPNVFYWRDFGCVYYLNDDYEGGEIYFPNQNITIKPKPNTLVFFPGNHNYLHGVKPMISGIRYTLTSFWTFDETRKMR